MHGTVESVESTCKLQSSAALELRHGVALAPSNGTVELPIGAQSEHRAFK